MASSHSAAASQLSRLQENGRIATDLIVTDLKRAGYLGGNSNVPDISGTTAPDHPRQPSAALPVIHTWGRMISNNRVGGDNDDTDAGYACIPDADYLARRHTGRAAMRQPWIDSRRARRRPACTCAARCSSGRDFHRQRRGRSSQHDVPTRQGQLSVRELQAHAYFVGTVRTQLADGNPVPSLWRVRMADTGLAPPRRSCSRESRTSRCSMVSVPTIGDNATLTWTPMPSPTGTMSSP